MNMGSDPGIPVSNFRTYQMRGAAEANSEQLFLPGSNLWNQASLCVAAALKSFNLIVVSFWSWDNTIDRKSLRVNTNGIA